LCVIVDNDVAVRVLLRSQDPDFFPIYNCLVGGKSPALRMVYGGQLRDEYLRNNAIRRILRELDRAGRLIAIDDGEIEMKMEEIRDSGTCCSNDIHIIAIARLAKVRLLASHDKDLQTDFTNSRVLNKPRGKVFKKASHIPLLRRGCKSIT
jgi:hypothetical protein